MKKFQKARVKLTNTKLNKLIYASKTKTETILRINKKIFQDEEFPNELHLTARQTSKTRTAFANNMSTDIKLREAQKPKMIQSNGFLHIMLGTLN